MRVLLCSAFIAVLISASGCDADQGAFEDTLPDVYTLTTGAAPDTGGSIFPSGGEYITGRSIQIEASPAEGYIFDYWEGDLSGNKNPEELIISRNRSVTAHFTERDYNLNIQIKGEGSVRETVIEHSAFVIVSLAADADSGWFFDRWEGDRTGSENPETITIEDEDKSVTAVFEQDAVTGIAVDEVKLYIVEMEMDGARRTKDFKTKNFVLNLPLDGTRFRITHTEIPAGFYDELQLDIERPEKNEDVDDPDFIDGSNRYSLVVKGVFNGEQFIFRSTEDFEIDVDMRPHLEITEGQNTVIAIDIDFEGWFGDSNGEILDPSDSRNREQINENIEDSFSDFEDEF